MRIKESKRSVVANSKTVAMNKKNAAKNANNPSSSKDVFDLNTGVIFRKDKKKVCLKVPGSKSAYACCFLLQGKLHLKLHN